MNSLKIILSLTLISSSLYAADNIALVELLKDDAVNTAYNECKNATPGSENKTIEVCIWDKLDDQKKDEVKKKMELLKQAEAGSKDTKVKYEGLSLAPTDDNKDSKSDKDKETKDPEMAKLEEFLSKRLGESLYGEINTEQQKTNPAKVVDHKVFYDLYEAQISKNVISAISSYCIEAQDGPLFLIPQNADTRKQTRQKNIDKLKDFSPSAVEGEKSTNTSAQQWNGCAKNIQDTCDERGEYAKIKDKSDKEFKVEKADYKYSKPRACVITKLLKNARQSLLKITQIKKVMEENATESGRGLQGNKEIEVYSGGKDKSSKSIDDLTSLTSSELAKSGYKEGVDEKKKLIEKCEKASDATDPACEGIILSKEKADEEQKKLEEYALRTEVLTQKLKDDKTMTKEEVGSYLKEQGYSEDDIKKMLEKDLAKVREEIAQRYEQEKEAINKELKARLEKKTVKQDDKDNESKTSRINELKKELDSKPEEYKQLIHYNNVVQGFLSFKGDDGGDNAVSIARELESTEGLSEEEIKKREELKTQLQAQGIKMDNSDKGKDAVKIEVENINKQLLKYEFDVTPTPTPTKSN